MLASFNQRKTPRYAMGNKGIRLSSFFLMLLMLGCGSGPSGAENSVVFIGSSTIERWPHYTSFAAHGWIDNGINGDTSSGCRARFQQTVVDIHPAGVLIYCGTNDMNVVSYSSQAIVENWISMLRAAQAAGITTYIATLLPLGPGPLADQLSYPGRNEQIIMLNARMAEIATAYGATLVDFHRALARADGAYNPVYTDDGVHPNENGYAVLTRLAEATISPAKGAPQVHTYSSARATMDRIGGFGQTLTVATDTGRPLPNLKHQPELIQKSARDPGHYPAIQSAVSWHENHLEVSNQ